ncbi:hypothetical protein QTN25_010207 [Entamoeba marina]
MATEPQTTSLVKVEKKEEQEETLENNEKKEIEETCSDDYDYEDELQQNVIFEKFVIQNLKFPHNLVGRFADLWGMMEQEIKPNGVLSEYWDEFPGNEDFKEISGNKPWDDSVQQSTNVDCFNYGFDDEVWKCYRKKHNILKKYLKNLVNDTEDDHEKHHKKELSPSRHHSYRRSSSRPRSKRHKSRDHGKEHRRDYDRDYERDHRRDYERERGREHRRERDY